VIQGDPAATAAKMPVIDLNGQHSIIPNKNNDLDWATLRKFALTNTGTQSNGNGGIALNQGASAQTCDGLILEYLDIGNFGETVSGQNCGGMTFAQKPGSWWPTVTPIVRYCKFHDCYAPGSGTPWFDFQNVSGLYLGKFCALEVHNCEFLKCAMSFFQKDSSTEGSLAHPNSVNLHHNIIATSYGGIRFLGAGASAPAGIFSAVIDSNLVYDTFTAFDFEQVDGGAQSDVLTFKNNTLSADSGQVSGLLSGGLTNLTLYDNVVLGSNGSGSIHNLYVIAISGCTNSVAYSDYNRWKVTSFRAEGTTYSALSNWQAANTAIVSLPDAHSATTTESAAFNSAGTRDYSPKAAGPLVATGRFGGNIGCYDATSIAGSTLVGAGW
jgi:hypothetical protein